MKLLRTALLALVVFTMAACDEEKLSPTEVQNKMIDGDWEIYSWVINGTELVVSGVTIDMVFDQTSVEGGDMSWSINDNGYVDVSAATYIIYNEGDGIDVNGNPMSLTLTESSLEMSGLLNGNQVRIRGDRD